MKLELFRDIIITDSLTKFNIVFNNNSTKLVLDKNIHFIDIGKNTFSVSSYESLKKNNFLTYRYENVELIEVIE